MTLAQKIEEIKAQLESVLTPREIDTVIRAFKEDILKLPLLHEPFELSSDQIEVLDQACKDIAMGFPLDYVTGVNHFFGLKLKVNASVLIPRSETEELVDWFLTDYNQVKRPLKVLDIGTGSGCIPIAIKKNAPHFDVSAFDVSALAVELAATNAKQNDVNVNFFVGDFLDKEYKGNLGMYDIIISNPPYIDHDESGEMGMSVLNHEPHIALFTPNNDSNIFYRLIAEFAKKHLKNEGRIYVELNEFKANEIQSIFNESYATQLKYDMRGRPRMLRSIPKN